MRLKSIAVEIITSQKTEFIVKKAIARADLYMKGNGNPCSSLHP